jgi:hypothetical protein
MVYIASLAKIFRGHALLWYMKYHKTKLTGKSRTLADIGQALLKKFQKLKYKSKYIT